MRRTRSWGCGRHEANSHLPHVTPLVVEAELEVSETIHCCLDRNDTDGNANLIRQCDVLVARILRDEVRTLQVKRPELVDQDRPYAYFSG